MYKYFLGIDISKDSFDFSFTDETEKVSYEYHYHEAVILGYFLPHISLNSLRAD